MRSQEGKSQALQFLEGYMRDCCLRPAQFYTQENPFSMVQWSSTSDQGTIEAILSLKDSRFSLNIDSRRTLFHLERTRDPLPAIQCLGKRPLCSGCLIVWEGIRLDWRTLLHVFGRVSVIDLRHTTDDIFETYVRFLRGSVGPDFIFMNVKAHLQRAHLVDAFMKGGDIFWMNWSAKTL